MPSITGVNWERVEEVRRKERLMRESLRDLLSRLPRCNCGTAACYQLPDGSHVCLRCVIDEDRDAAEQDFPWARSAMRLDCIAAEWKAEERGDETGPDDVYDDCHRAARQRLKWDLRESLWGIGEGLVTIYGGAGFRTEVCESLDEVFAFCANRYALVFEVYAGARYGLPLTPAPGHVLWAVHQLVGGQDALRRMRSAWGKDKVK